MISLKAILIISFFMFSLGVYGLIARKNLIGVLIAFELIFNSANLNLIVFNRLGFFENADGFILAMFIMLIAAIEAALAFAILVGIYKHIKVGDIDKAISLKEKIE